MAARRRKAPVLSSLAVADSDAGATGGDLVPMGEFKAADGIFESGDVMVNEKGLHIADVESRDYNVRFEDLDLVRDIGSGCSSIVKLARHKVTGEYYALKCISLYMKQMRDQLLTELRTLFKSDCAALVDFHGALYREGYVAVILEYMDLGGLDGVVKRAGVVPEPVLAAMSYQMLWGLGYLAHERRVHRDIKPMNVLVNSKGQVKLTDFGISRELATAVLAKTFVGSFKYMSPERMGTMPYNYSSDIWSFGLVLYECACNKYPYPESASHIDYVTTVLDSDVPKLPAEFGFSPEFQEFLDACLEKNPDHRASALSLLDFPWLEMHGATDLDSAVETVRAFLVERGIAIPEGSAK